MSDTKAKEELVEFLNKKAFDPVLRKKLDEYNSKREKEKLQDVKQATESTKEKYNKEYGTADEVVKRFKDDLNSSAAKKIHEELKQLGLPALPELKDDFSKLAERLGVRY